MKFNQFPPRGSLVYTILDRLQYEPELHANPSTYVFDVSFAAHVPLFDNNNKHPCLEHFILQRFPQEISIPCWLTVGMIRGYPSTQRFVA